MEFEPRSLRLQFLQHGVRTASELSRAAKVSQPTISRALGKFSDSLLRIGRGRVARYAMKSPIEELGSEWPLYVIGSAGTPEQVGQLHSLLGEKYWLERATNRWPSLFDDTFKDNIFPDIPWFLDDYRPQGFLGRAFARKHADALGHAANPTGWSGRVVLEAMLRFGDDFTGAFVLGRESLAAAMTATQSPVIDSNRENQYPRLAERALSGELVGSSAGGEQPKFLADFKHSAGTRHLMVKFSPPMSEPIGRRWGDLLYAEHLASTVLAANGFAVAKCEILDAGDRRFLEIERFDRFSAAGRAPVISLMSMSAALLDGTGSPWPEVANTLREKNWLLPDDASQLASAWRFGKLIANTDMHDGNASLILTPERPARLAPVYDMLPMAYRPSNQGHVPGVSETEIAIASEATSSMEREMAEVFWSELSSSTMVSPDFREIAGKHAKAFCAGLKSRSVRSDARQQERIQGAGIADLPRE